MNDSKKIKDEKGNVDLVGKKQGKSVSFANFEGFIRDPQQKIL